jgi:hypothetical protein
MNEDKIAPLLHLYNKYKRLEKLEQNKKDKERYRDLAQEMLDAYNQILRNIKSH